MPGNQYRKVMGLIRRNPPAKGLFWVWELRPGPWESDLGRTEPSTTGLGIRSWNTRGRPALGTTRGAGHTAVLSWASRLTLRNDSFST